MMEVFENPVTIAVCRIGEVRGDGGQWSIRGFFQDHNSDSRPWPMLIIVKESDIVGNPTKNALIFAVGRLKPSGGPRRRLVHIYAKNAKIVPTDADNKRLDHALDEAIQQMKTELDHIQWGAKIDADPEHRRLFSWRY